jgi:hypothetical protein
MKKMVSRRDFMKVTGVGLGALAFRPFDFETLYTPKRLPQFPASEIIGRIVGDTDIRSRPTNDPVLNTSIGIVEQDVLVEWGREVIGSVAGLPNQNYLETPQGYIYAPRVQPTRNLQNTPITEIPDGQPGFWAEVTVPYILLTLEGPPISTWIQDHIKYNFAAKVVYGQTIWIDQIRQANGFVEYRWNESPNGHGYGFGDLFWLDGAGLKVLTEAEVAPISPEIDPAEKKIVASLTYQTLSCFEGTNEVYFCRMSSGAVLDAVTGLESDERATPAGERLIDWKIISINMSGGGSAGYSTPAVPWATFTGQGIAIHGAFWHNDFGVKRSHGCLNVKPQDAKWIFRWTTPYVSLAQSEIRLSLPDHGTIVNITELKV